MTKLAFRTATPAEVKQAQRRLKRSAKQQPTRTFAEKKHAAVVRADAAVLKLISKIDFVLALRHAALEEAIRICFNVGDWGCGAECAKQIQAVIDRERGFLKGVEDEEDNDLGRKVRAGEEARGDAYGAKKVGRRHRKRAKRPARRASKR